MKRAFFAGVASVLFCAVSAFASPTATHEYNGNCAWGLTQGKEMKTDCKITWQDPKSHATYCFSSEEAKANWAKDTMGNEKKADAEFAKMSTHETAHKS